ncbi:MAG: CBS domain-containing protein [Nitrospirae bacterium]|nr:CBS domain-containing protein [Nitrospirota bacterium]
MKIGELLATKGADVISLESDRTVEDAIKVLQNRKISAIMVTDKGAPVGIFAERDVLKCYLNSECKEFAQSLLKDAMTPNPIVADMNDDMEEAMSIMIDKNIRHLPIADKGRVIGMLSIRDIVKSQVTKMHSDLHTLKDYISGTFVGGV